MVVTTSLTMLLSLLLCLPININIALFPPLVKAEESPVLASATPSLFDSGTNFERLNDGNFQWAAYTTYTILAQDIVGTGLKEYSLHMESGRRERFHNFFVQNYWINNYESKTLENSKIFLGIDKSELSTALTWCFTGIWDSGFFLLDQNCRDSISASVITIRREWLTN